MLFAVGVGPGSTRYLTDEAKEAIRKSDFIVGYRYTLATIADVIDRAQQKVFEVTMKTQEETYRQVYGLMRDGQYCTVPFTGDSSFSESEVVDRLLQIFGEENVVIIPGISSIQVAAARSKVPLDKALVLTLHVTGDIEKKKEEMIAAVKRGLSIIVVPRPWPKDPSKHFMQSEIAKSLRENGIDTRTLRAWVFEHLTTEKESSLNCTVRELEGRQFSDLSVMVIDQSKRLSYLEF